MTRPDSADCDATMWTLGQLDAGDLGSVVTFRDGGATYTGSLTRVEHSLNLRDLPMTMVVVEDGPWRHIKSYPADTPVGVTSPGASDA